MLRFRQFGRFPLEKCVAVVFAVAMVGIGFVQAVHVHDDLAKQSTPPSHCSLCVAAHQTAEVVATSGMALPVVKAALVALPETQHESCLYVTEPFIRPPPQVL